MLFLGSNEEKIMSLVLCLCNIDYSEQTIFTLVYWLAVKQEHSKQAKKIRLIDFNSMSTQKGLFYSWRLGNHVHYKFISILFVQLLFCMQLIY